MKNLIIILFFLNCPISLFSQAFVNLNFENNYTYKANFWIESTPLNIWQIGKPQKLFFDSALTFPNSIMTDTIHNYPINCLSSFTISLQRDSVNIQPDWFWGVPYINFYHKFDMDSLHDGGFIEVSYNSGQTWNNIILDTISNHNPDFQYYFQHNDFNFYSINDTINGGIPAFTGRSNGWIQSGFHFDGCYYTFPLDSIMVRFTFKSDSINNEREGWLIDNIYFGVDICSSISKTEISGLKIYPTFTNDKLNIENTYLYRNVLEIIDITGSVVYKNYDIKEKIIIDVSKFMKGMYFVKLNTNKFSDTKKIIIN